MSVLGVGVIGSGRIAQGAHLPGIARADGLRLVAVSDPSPTLRHGVAARWGVRSYADAADLLADPEVDLVVIAVPDRFHAPLAIQALEAGIPTLVEKPLAPSVAEAEAVLAAAQRTGIPLQIGAMKRYDPGVRAARTAIAEGIGELLSASLWYRVMSALRPPVEASQFPDLVIDAEVRAVETAHKQRGPEHLLLTHGAHLMDTAMYAFGEVERLTARHVQAGVDHSWTGLLHHAAGWSSSFEITASAHAPWAEGFVAHGTAGRVRADIHFPFERRASDVEIFSEETLEARRPAFGFGDAFALQLQGFADAIRTGSQPSPGPVEGLAVVRLLAAVQASASADGDWVQP